MKLSNMIKYLRKNETLEHHLECRLVQANTERANPNLGGKEKGILDSLRRELVQDLQARP